MKLVFLMSACALFLVGCANAPGGYTRLSDDPCSQAWLAALGAPTHSGSPQAESLSNANRAELVCKGYAVPPPPPAPITTHCQPNGLGPGTGFTCTTQ
jgi:hypothetical protein